MPNFCNPLSIAEQLLPHEAVDEHLVVLFLCVAASWINFAALFHSRIFQKFSHLVVAVFMTRFDSEFCIRIVWHEQNPEPNVKN